MNTEYNLPTIYDGSKLCKGCGTLMNPLTSAFSGPTGTCPDCRNQGHKKNLKNAMSKGR